MSNGRILVADDEPAVLRGMQRVLRHRYELDLASDPVDALAKAQASTPDLAILDIRMPGMDGFELMAQLKAKYERLDVILMTGLVSELDSQLIRSLRERAFYFLQKPFDRDLLLTLVERCFDLRRLAHENRQHVSRLENELGEARAFQQSLVPPRMGTPNGIEVHGRYEPSKELGGDLYDYAAAGCEQAAFLVADVSGKGVSAAMLTGIVKSAFRDAQEDGFDPGAVVRNIARGIGSFDHDRFVTLFCGRLCRKTGALEYVSAGHEPAILLGPEGGVKLLHKTGPLVSPILEEGSWTTACTELAPDQRLLLYTDGTSEAKGPQGLFGMERLLEVASCWDGGLGELLDEIWSRVLAFSEGRPRSDDLTLLALQQPRT